MKRFQVRYSSAALKAIRKLDPSMARFIAAWIRKNLEGCADPRAHGRGLPGNRAGQWRYRMGNCRLLAEIGDGQVVILAVVNATDEQLSDVAEAIYNADDAFRGLGAAAGMAKAATDNALSKFKKLKNSTNEWWQ